MLKNHMRLMHGIKNPDLGQMSKTSSQDSKKALGKVTMAVRGYWLQTITFTNICLIVFCYNFRDMHLKKLL